MFRITVCVCAFLLLACCVLPMAAQQPAAASANAAVPPMVNFSGVLTDVNGKPMAGTVGVTFYLYQRLSGRGTALDGNAKRESRQGWALRGRARRYQQPGIARERVRIGRSPLARGAGRGTSRTAARRC